MHVVVVESPAKAKTINKYLGNDYKVLASFGHVRDLPAKDGSVDPKSDFEMTYEIDAGSKKHISDIAKALKGADTLFLATDPDREGEAISWHILEALVENKSLPKKIDIKRVVFEEITKRAVLEAFTRPRDIDMDLVNAQQARRALDYLVGFNLSPVLWRKLPGSKSAGRVQSVALRLICERDAEIEQFVSREYWDIKAQMLASGKPAVTARLIEYEGVKLEKFSITNEKQATVIADALRAKQYAIKSLEPKQVRKHPAPPFTTSTLQQEAARKCGFSAKKTMQLAQKLYEGVELGGETAGLITYMRTDAVTVSQEALNGARAFIAKTYGDNYLPNAPRMYKTKAKNAQEAHEAIRPTDVSRTPDAVKDVLDRDMFRLYELVWKRMMASQMESAVYDQLIVDIASTDDKASLRTTGSVIKFDGFLKLYQEGRDDEADEDGENTRLPEFNQGEKLSAEEVSPEQHFTEPPPRYSEASLVKKLEELGIGRPSTYAAIISVLQERGYVKLEKKRFVAEPLGRVVTAFLTSFFERYVEYGFTADMENQLDDISAGERDWKAVLREFWGEFSSRIDEGKKLPMENVLSSVGNALDAFVFGTPKEGEADPHVCPSCSKRLGLRLGRYGAYIGCEAYPDCNYKRQLQISGDSEGAEGETEMQLPKVLGNHPETGEAISLRKGPYGFYVQLGEEKKPKRASLPKSSKPEELTLEMALSLLALPREVGLHPESKKPIVANQGRFGPYLLYDNKFYSLPAEDDLLTVGINRAVDIIATAGNKQAGSEPLKELGNHPEDGKPVSVMKGRYGPYVKHGKINATLPKGVAPEEITLEKAVELLAAKKGGGKAKKTAKPKGANARSKTA